MPTLFTVVMAGGSGTRFWPASTRKRPKQLLSIGAHRGESLIASTVRRVEPLCPAERTLIATGEHLLEATKKALPWLPDSSFLGEPVARNTAACIGWATAIVRRRAPDGVVMVLPSDHDIADEDGFRKAVEVAVRSADAGSITTLGITPTRPDIGYGYIKVGDEIGDGAFRVAKFVEKPDTLRAKEYLASKRYVWNSGMFFFKAQTMMEAIQTHMPALAEGLQRIDDAGAEEERVTRDVFEGLDSVSIDYGVMEKASSISVVPASFGWSDVGSWQSAWELADKDEKGNAADDAAVLVDANRNLVRDLRTEAGKKTLALVGVDDLCVIETDEALLIVPREKSQDVRKLVEKLRERGVID